MIQGFRDFVLRGNIVELAVAVVIGSAFAALVGAFTDNIVTPVLASVGGDGDVQGLAFRLVAGNDATLVDLGGVLGAVIQFLITAAVVYVVFVVPMNKLSRHRNRDRAAAEQAPAPDIELLTEIRDLLRAQRTR